MKVWVGAGVVGILAVFYAVGTHYYEPSCAPASPVFLSRPARVADEVSIALVGDTALTDASPQDALEPTRRFLSDADLAIANLEAPLTAHTDAPWLPKEYRYRMNPSWAKELAFAGLDVATLANNHAADYGAPGILDTVTRLAEHGVTATGAEASLADARRGVVATVGDTRIAILAYCERQWLWDVYVGQFATRSRAGVAPLSERALAEDIARMKQRADLVIVALHGGRNYDAPTKAMRRFAEIAVERGADLVVSHHSHIAGPVAVYRGKPILLGLGNFVFGTIGHPNINFGLMARVTVIRRAIARVDLFALDVQNRRVAYRPRPLDGSALEDAMGWLVRESAAIGTTLLRAGDHAVLNVVTKGAT